MSVGLPGAANGPTVTPSGPGAPGAGKGGADALATAVAGPEVLGSLIPSRAILEQLDPSIPDSPRRRRRRRLPRPVVRLGKVLVIALIIEYLVVPQIGGAGMDLHLLGSVNPLLLLAGLALEVAAVVAYAALTRSILGARSPGLGTVLRIQVTTLSVSHCVPGGTAAGSSLGYRLFTQAGVDGADVGFALATQSLGSAVILNVIFWLALVVSIPVWGFSPLYLTAAVVGLVLISLFAGVVLLMTRGEQWAATTLERAAAKVPFLRADMLRQLFEQLAGRLRELGADPKMVARATGWAAANWLLDAASLFVFVGAFGHWVNPDGLLVAYGLANVLAAIPLTPGGLGVVESTLTPALVGFHTTRAVAILGVLSWRLVNFWLPIPLGGITYLSLQVDPGHTDDDVRRGRRQVLRRRAAAPLAALRRLVRRSDAV